MRALIVGGGIGGLATGIALRRVGIESVIVEQAHELEAVGAGLGLAANAVHALERLGVVNAVRARGLPTDRLVALTPNGDALIDLPLEGREMLGVHAPTSRRFSRASSAMPCGSGSPAPVFVTTASG